MLGKQPCLLRTTSSRSLLIPCDDAEGEPAIVCNYAQVSEKNTCPALSAPCKIVIGFNIGAEKKPHSDACESPRSVLDTLVLQPSQEKQHIVARSPRSGLGSLLTVKSGSGDGLEIVAQILDKEAGVHVGSVAGSFKATFHLQNCMPETHPDKMGLPSKSSHCHSKDTSWLSKLSESDFMDSDIPSWQRQAPCILSVEDEVLDADIAPRQSRAMFSSSSEDTNANFSDMNISPYQSRAFDACLSNGSKGGCLDTDTFSVCSQAPWQIGLSHDITPSNVINNERIKARVCTWQSGASDGPGSVGAVGGCINYHWQRQALDMESEEISTQRSIFSAASPPCPHSLITPSSGFLKVCAFCGHSLRLGKDIFMYRGDQAFCSAECRYQKIVLDECKEMQGN